MFLLWFDDLPLVTLLFICGKHFEFFQASSDSAGQNIWKPLLLVLRLRVRQGQGRCCVDLL